MDEKERTLLAVQTVCKAWQRLCRVYQRQAKD
jgi:hypothetical protein